MSAAAAASKPSCKRSSTAFRQFQQSYFKHKQQPDIHIRVFQEMQDTFGPFTKVLYPGCHRHISASVVFPNVVYVDSDPKVANVYTDSVTDEWIAQHKTYKGPTQKQFLCANFENMNSRSHSSLGKPKIEIDDSFDLLISLSAGIVSTPCLPYLQSGYYLLVNDSHSDARMAFLNPQLQLVAVWDEDSQTFCTEPAELQQHFHYKPAKQPASVSASASDDACSLRPITMPMVQESIRIGTKSKRSFRLQKEGMFYVFRKHNNKRQKRDPAE